MKRVLFYTDTPNLGGAEKHMLLLAKHLSKKGVKISLAYGRYSQVAKLHSDFEKYCENVYVLNTLHKHDPRHYTELRKLLRRKDFDLFHIHLWNPGSARYAFRAADKLVGSIITTEHDPFELSGMKKWIKAGCLRRTDMTIVVSSDNYRLLEEYYQVPKERLEMVPNGIEIDRFTDNTETAALPVEKGGQIVTCIAELHHRKGHRYLLEAFRKVQAHMPSVHLVLVGRGPEESRLKSRFANVPNLHFLGWRDDIPQILRASDILVLPSLKEAFGQVLLEAMASEVACVATNNGGPADVIQDGLTGYLVPPANSQAIAEKISVLLKNPTQKRDIEKAALHRLKQEFTADKMAEGTLAAYEKIC